MSVPMGTGNMYLMLKDFCVNAILRGLASDEIRVN